MDIPPLSHSSASTLAECEMRYYNYKIAKVPEDPDYERSTALAVGSAFHWIMEKSRHEKPESITKDLATCVRDPAIGLSEEDVPLVHGMILRYLRLHKRMGLRVLAIETEIRTEWMHGYVDAILEEGDGSWWICDLKTFKTLMPSAIKQLPMDPQLNLYGGHADYIANLLGLLPEKFKGVRWRVVSKTTAKQKKTESYVDYVRRLADDHITATDIPVPKALLHTDERMAQHFQLWIKSAHLRSGELTPAKNYRACFNYFSPCAYFSRCHGSLFTEPVKLEITEE